MHTEDFVVHNRCDRQTVEALREHFPQFHRIPPFALIKEPVVLGDPLRLMIPPQDEEVLWVLDLVADEEAECLDALLSPVHIVSQEEVVGCGRVPEEGEDPE